MVAGPRLDLHRHLHHRRVWAIKAAGMGLDLRHYTLPCRLPAAEGRTAKAHRRHGFAGIRRRVRRHRRSACRHKGQRAFAASPAYHCCLGKHRSQHIVALAQIQRCIAHTSGTIPQPPSPRSVHNEHNERHPMKAVLSSLTNRKTTSVKTKANNLYRHLPSLALQKAAIGRLKGRLSACERRPFVKLMTSC